MISIDKEKCKGCNLCIEVCPKYCLNITTKTNKIGYETVDYKSKNCVSCYNCIEVCPESAIKPIQDK